MYFTVLKAHIFVWVLPRRGYLTPASQKRAEKKNVDIQIVTEVFKHYATRPNKNIPILSEYAKVLKVEPKLRAYLEVLL